MFEPRNVKHVKNRSASAAAGIVRHRVRHDDVTRNRYVWRH